LTSDETSNLRCKEIEDIENLAMFFNNTISWKDCLVECGIILHKVASFHVNLCSWWWKHYWHRQTSCNTIGVATSRWVKT
jgi:hypothetical protein